MSSLALVSYFFGGAFAANAIPHAIAGMMGRSFQSPFAKPSGRGLSSPTVNVLWAFTNAAAAYLLVLHVGQFNARLWSDALALAVGALLIGLGSARHFGQFYRSGVPSQP